MATLNFVLFLNALFLHALHCDVRVSWRNYPNYAPIIGILAEDRPLNVSSKTVQTYIAASYVKFVECGGARVVPIHLGKEPEYTRKILDSINGVLIPGGGAPLNDSMYATTGKEILDYAIQRNEAGDYFPVWATCLGFELLASYLAPNQPVLVSCQAEDMALPLNFTPDATSGSRLFSNLPANIFQALTQQNVTANFHHSCLTPQGVKEFGLDQRIKVLSTNFDSNQLEFVSTFESSRYPFYAVQWHPEKAPWEWTTKWKNIPHSPEAIAVAQYFALFLGNEARKNTHHFSEEAREKQELIYNINARYTGKNGSSFEQQYLINESLNDDLEAEQPLALAVESHPSQSQANRSQVPTSQRPKVSAAEYLTSGSYVIHSYLYIITFLYFII